MTHRVILRSVMAYVIKRYANRKLYDTRTKHYLTLNDLTTLVRAGEDLRVEDAESGEDLTAQILTKIVAEGSRKGGALVLPQGMLVDWIQRPSEFVFDAVRTSVSAGQRTVEQMGSEIGKLIDNVAKRASGAPAKKSDDVGEEIARVIEERLKAIISELNLPARSELEALAQRLTELEASLAKKATSARVAKPAKKAAASKSVKPPRQKVVATPRPARKATAKA